MRVSGDKKRRDRRRAVQLLGMISQFGINMMVPIFLCFFAGRLLDKHFGTVWWTIVLFFVGALAGFRNIYVFAKKFFKNDEGQVDSTQRSGGAMDRDSALGSGASDTHSDIP
ncbi:MAG: AtpZ/AtpI family protein [Lachnospiraceae bacterium]|nr:AtpZ/AtpI family protein [Lachnospiraceae bacterium]